MTALSSCMGFEFSKSIEFVAAANFCQRQSRNCQKKIRHSPPSRVTFGNGIALNNSKRHRTTTLSLENQRSIGSMTEGTPQRLTARCSFCKENSTHELVSRSIVFRVDSYFAISFSSHIRAKRMTTFVLAAKKGLSLARKSAGQWRRRMLSTVCAAHCGLLHFFLSVVPYFRKSAGEIPFWPGSAMAPQPNTGTTPAFPLLGETSFFSFML